MAAPVDERRLARENRLWVGILLLAIVAFGVVVEVRGALLHKRWTDLSVFVRAAWAVRSGADVYAITDDKGLPYNYPPLLAILLTPLADPPAGATMPGTPPFAVTVGLWYALSVAFLLLGIHALAAALEATCPALVRLTAPAGSRRWWLLRLLPLTACIAPVGQALSLGQVNVLWLALSCAMAAALVRGHSFRAGFWLAGPICLKVVPAFLLVYPAWRRDFRCLAGCALGLGIGLAVVPAAVLGPERAVASNRAWAEAVLLPAFGMGSDHSRDKDLLGVGSTHNQALMAIIHKTMYLDRDTRPDRVAPGVRFVHWAVGGALTGVALLAAGRRRRTSGLAAVLFLGALHVNMLLLSPAGHAHYLVLLLPLVMALVAASGEADEARRRGRHAHPLNYRLVLGLAAVNVTAGALPLLPGLKVLHDVGLPMYSALLIWAASVVVLWRRSPDGWECAEGTVEIRAAA